MDLNTRLLQLEEAYQALDPDQQQRHSLNQQTLDFIDNYLQGLEQRPAFCADSQLQSSFEIDQQTQPLSGLLNQYLQDVISKGIVPSSGGHVGYIPGGGIYTSSLADYIAAVSNEYSGIFYASPGAVSIENECIEWLKRVFSFPQNAVGNLTSGGSIANLIALTAARDKYKIKNEVIKNSVIYLSSQVHHCLHKAIRIIGLEDIQYRLIDLDSQFRMQPEVLEKAIQKDLSDGLNPFLIVASAGTTDTGAIDPLDAMADLAEKFRLWFHVDAAYGGFFVMVDEMQEKFQGMQRANSLVVDPHKGLFIPYGLGAVLVNDREAVMHSHHYLANYMQDATQNASVDSPADLSPELTKHFRGLRLWLPLKLHGVEPFKKCLQHKLLLTHYFRQQLQTIGFELGPPPDLSVSFFYFPVDKSIRNAFNRKLLEHIHEDGRVFLSSTIIDDQFVIRMAILAFRTSKKTIDTAMDMIDKCLIKTKLEFGIK